VEKSVADRIEKEVVLRAPRARVWEALTDVDQLGEWFQIKFSGKVAPGSRLSGPITYPGHEGIMFEAVVEEVVPQRKLSWRWHPDAVDQNADYSQEPTTLVTFELEDVAGGTRLRVVESGFHRIPVVRRAKAFESNTGGWAEVVQSIAKTIDALVGR
jgi:uncharacterized protein YndB with AHSA1/START domain